MNFIEVSTHGEKGPDTWTQLVEKLGNDKFFKLIPCWSICKCHFSATSIFGIDIEHADKLCSCERVEFEKNVRESSSVRCQLGSDTK